jgi:hypothetical protein
MRKRYANKIQPSSKKSENNRAPFAEPTRHQMQVTSRPENQAVPIALSMFGQNAEDVTQSGDRSVGLSSFVSTQNSGSSFNQTAGGWSMVDVYRTRTLRKKND